MNLEKYKVFYEKFLASAMATWLKFILAVLALGHLCFLSKGIQNVLPEVLLKLPVMLPLSLYKKKV